LEDKLASRFYKEGYDVHILNNKEKDEKYVSYNLDIEDPKFRDVFLENDFDVVICTRENIKNSLIIKILEYCNNSKNFIFLSSIYSERGSRNKLFLEKYLNIYREEFSVNISLLNIGKTYGAEVSDNNCIVQIIDNKCSINNEYINYIHVGDIVDAVYKVSQKNSSLSLNIVSDYMYNKEEISGIYKENILKKSTVNNISIKDVGIKSNVENEKAKLELGWRTKFNIEDGLREIYILKEKEKISLGNQSIKNNKRMLNLMKDKVNVIRPYVENILLFIIFCILNLSFKEKILDMNMNLNLIYILIISIVYGTSQSIISIILASGMGLLLKIQDGMPIVALLYDTDILIRFVLYLFVGMFLGYIIDSKNSTIKNYEKELKSVAQKFDFINDKYKKIRHEKKLLEEQIVSSNESIGKLYWIIEKLNSLSPELIFDEAVLVISNIMKSKEACIYIFSKDKTYLRLITRTKELNKSIRKSININEYKEMQKSIEKKEIFVNRDMLNDIPIMLCPIIIEGDIIGMVGVNNIPFEDLSLYKYNLFKVIVNIITNSLSISYKYERAILDQKYLRGTEILKTTYFKELVKLKCSIPDNNNILLKVKKEDYKYLKNCIRTSDYLGTNERKELLVLLVNTTSEEARVVTNRLLERNIASEIIDSKYILGV